MTNLEAIAGLLRIEKITGELCTDCEQRTSYVYRKPSGFIDVICCAGCFTMLTAVHSVLQSPRLNEDCNVAILMDLSISPSIIMQVDKHIKTEEKNAGMKLGEIFRGVEDHREIIDSLLEAFRETAKVWNTGAMSVYMALLRTQILMYAAMIELKRQSLLVITSKQS